MDSISNNIISLINLDFSPFTYKWYLNDDLLVNQLDSILFPNQSGIYRIEVTDNFGCKLLSNSLQYNSQNYSNPDENNKMTILRFTIFLTITILLLYLTIRKIKKN